MVILHHLNLAIKIGELIPKKNPVKQEVSRIKKMASDLHHTATTLYPCCVPTLGDFKGAGCVGLAAANLQSILFLDNNFYIFFIYFLID